MAVNTLNLLQVQCSKPFTETESHNIISGLINYLKLDQPQDAVVTPDEAATLGKAAFAKIGL